MHAQIIFLHKKYPKKTTNKLKHFSQARKEATNGMKKKW